MSQRPAQLLRVTFSTGQVKGAHSVLSRCESISEVEGIFVVVIV